MICIIGSFIAELFFSKKSWINILNYLTTIEYSVKIGERTESLFFYMWPFHFVLSIGMGLMCVVAFLQFIEDIHSYIKGDHFTQEIEAATDV